MNIQFNSTSFGGKRLSPPSIRKHENLINRWLQDFETNMPNATQRLLYRVTTAPSHAFEPPKTVNLQNTSRYYRNP